MKVTSKLLLFAIAFTFLLIACKKNHADQPAGITKVKQLSFLYNDNTGNPPEPSQVDFTYDGYDRVKSMLIYLGDSGIVIPSTDTMTTVNFSYNGTDKLPYLIFIKKHVNGGTTESHLLSYDASNRITKDSINNQYSILYSYGGEKTMRYDTYVGSWANDTLVSQNGNYTQFLQRGNAVHYEFDNKINPLNNLNIGPVYHVIAIYGGIWSFWTASNRNNITVEKIYSSGVLQSTQHKATYIYNEQGLPKKRIWYNSYAPYNVIDTMTYKY